MVEKPPPGPSPRRPAGRRPPRPGRGAHGGPARDGHAPGVRPRPRSASRRPGLGSVHASPRARRGARPARRRPSPRRPRAGASSPWSAARPASARPASSRASPGDRAASARVLWGACDDLAVARPLGPFLDIASGDAPQLGEALRAPGRIDALAAVLAELGRERDTLCHRGRPLGGRGDPRPPRRSSRGASPRRRRSSSSPSATTSSPPTTRSGGWPPRSRPAARGGWSWRR